MIRIFLLMARSSGRRSRLQHCSTHKLTWWPFSDMPNRQKNGMLSTPQKHTDAPKTKTPKQNWVAYLDAHALQNPASLADEPKLPINQTDSKTKYGLVPQDLAVLSYFPKPHQKYGNTTKLYKEKEVQALAKKKEDVLLGDEGGI